MKKSSASVKLAKQITLTSLKLKLLREKKKALKAKESTATTSA
jgi:hypothetical protein